MSEKGLSYSDAGVNLEAAERSVDSIKDKVQETFRPEVLSGIGGFGGLFALDTGRYREPVLVSGTDGVGTKLKLAFATGIHNTVGIDLVAMCVNDILVSGAEPLFFLDYIAVGELSPEQVDSLVEGVAEGCKQAGCALIGGETAEMPGFYPPGEYDMAGFAVGVVEKKEIIDGSQIRPGDIVLGLASTGIHSNGLSLARKALFEVGGNKPESSHPLLKKTLAEELLTPTKIYVPSVLPLVKKGLIKGMAHITGGGILHNFSRVLPENCDAVLQQNWPVPPIFNIVQECGNIADAEMYRAFNMGIGFILVVGEKEAQRVIEEMGKEDEKVYKIGEIVPGKGEAKWQP
ncbi:MAG: phosphoribosylformylglycinamidine cyclo-ligase [Clostridia bacterium]|jgi:phosphoribosylformylglycinamidine cyclo-ligase|nr:phosphoribosylformylglycinamidine cyclo-ligase [Clostridiales bacterium]MDK2985961.1 phosphoribosylformylglycinamidine cyclo-ligase [Clostridia bacterium]